MIKTSPIRTEVGHIQSSAFVLGTHWFELQKFTSHRVCLVLGNASRFTWNSCSYIADFLLTFRIYHGSITYCCRDIRRFRSKLANFPIRQVHLTSQQSGVPLELGNGAWAGRMTLCCRGWRLTIFCLLGTYPSVADRDRQRRAVKKATVSLCPRPRHDHFFALRNVLRAVLWVNSLCSYTRKSINFTLSLLMCKIANSFKSSCTIVEQK